MAGFPVEARFFTRISKLLLHERHIDKTIRLVGPLKSFIDQFRAALNEIEFSISIEEEGFRSIVTDSKVEFEEVRNKAPDNWYISCEEAAEREIIAGIV